MTKTATVAALAAALTLAQIPAASAAPQTVSRFSFDSADNVVDGPESGTKVIGAASVSSGVIDFYGNSVVQTDDRDNLDPGTSDFSFTSTFKLTRGSGDWNIMQKGYWGDNQWKMSLDRTSSGLRILCRVAGDKGAVQANSKPGSIVEGRWVEVTCNRIGDTVKVLVNGAALGQGSGAIGRVANGRPYLVGGKEMFKKNRDQFLGLMDDVSVRVG